jgi:hypothetical protein
MVGTVITIWETSIRAAPWLRAISDQEFSRNAAVFLARLIGD